MALPLLRRSPHPFALFWLVPDGDKAHEVVQDPQNSDLVSLTGYNERAFDIGFHIRPHSRNTLVTLGRDEKSDIVIQGKHISRHQCSFEIDDLETGVVMFYDWSIYHTTEVSGFKTMPFDNLRDPKILVRPTFNNEIRIGTAKDGFVKFRLEWIINDDVSVARTVRSQAVNSREGSQSSRTEVPSRCITRIDGHLNMRYIKTARIGHGSFGTVYEAIDVDSGKIMALKEMDRPTGRWSETSIRKLRNEAETLAKLDHKNIIEVITSQGWNDPYIEIFMGRKEGNLWDLLERGCFKDGVQDSCFEQMLRALDYLAFRSIIHRDVKPNNILFTRNSDGSYHFQLSDFGECKLAAEAGSYAGTRWYMAPEVLENSGGAQTPKVDVWSLFVTMAYVLNVGGYQGKSAGSTERILAAARTASKDPRLSDIREMALEDPSHRASAAQMLVKHCKGEGLTTPIDQVPNFEYYGDLDEAASNERFDEPTTADLTMSDARTLPSDVSMIDVDNVDPEDIRNTLSIRNIARRTSPRNAVQRAPGPSHGQGPQTPHRYNLRRKA